MATAIEAERNMNTVALIQGIRFLDSFFPSGGFAFSSGLEAAAQAGAVRNPDEYAAYINDQLSNGIGGREAVAVGLAHDAASTNVSANVIAVDHELESMKLGLEGRKASRQMGRQVLRVAVEHFEGRYLLHEYLSAVEADRVPGHLAVVLGMTLQAADWTKEDSIAGFLYQTVVGYNAAAMKLLPIGQRESQRLLNEWTPLIVEISRKAAAEPRLSSWTPLQDIYAMRHSRLESRLFRS